LADTLDAHAASAITNTPAGNIAATTVQAAINELDSEKAATGHNHDASYAPLSHVGATGAAHGNASTSVAGFMAAADKTKLDGIEASATADQTAAEILTAIKTVDGAGSGLDADLLDGMQPASTNTVSTVVARDASGNFSAGTVTANLSGTASLANKFVLTDTRNVTTTPETLTSGGMVFDFKTNTAEGLSDTGTYFAEVTLRPWGTGTDWTGGPSHQLAYANSGSIYHRHGSSTTWGAWTKFLDSGNYNAYAPTLTGGNASGTWGINITGNAATVTNGVYSNGTYADPAWLTSLNYSKLTGTVPTWNQHTTGDSARTSLIKNTGYGTDGFTWYQSDSNFGVWTGGWASHLISNHGDGATYYNHTIHLPFDGPPQYSRKANGVNAGPFTFLTTENYTSYAATASHTHSYLPLSGGWMTGTLYGAGIAASTDSSGTASMEVKNNGGTGDSNLAAMAFHCDGHYGVKLYLRADGYFGLGGWSSGAWRWYSDPSGNMTASGNITAYSDPRLKENFERIADPMAILNQLDGGTFNWRHGFAHTEIKAGKRDYGVLADQVEAAMPEIVSESIEIKGERYKTVAYDKLVPVLIEAIKAQQRQIDELKAKVGV
jgi:hypothetical protein